VWLRPRRLHAPDAVPPVTPIMNGFFSLLETAPLEVTAPPTDTFSSLVTPLSEPALVSYHGARPEHIHGQVTRGFQGWPKRAHIPRVCGVPAPGRATLICQVWRAGPHSDRQFPERKRRFEFSQSRYTSANLSPPLPVLLTANDGSARPTLSR
jgi:hypothetical protein